MEEFSFWCSVFLICRRSDGVIVFIFVIRWMISGCFFVGSSESTWAVFLGGITVRVTVVVCGCFFLRILVRVFGFIFIVLVSILLVSLLGSKFSSMWIRFFFSAFLVVVRTKLFVCGINND